MTTAAPVSISSFKRFVAALAVHDWYFEYSDDGRVYRSGKHVLDALQAKAKEHPIYEQAFNLYSTSVLSTTEPLLQRIETREAALDKLCQQALTNSLIPA